MSSVNLNIFKEDKVHLNNVTKMMPSTMTNDDNIYNRTIVDLPLWYHTIVFGLLTTFGILGAILNSLVLRHFWLRRNNQTSYNYILINLAVAELILAVVGVSSDVMALIQRGWVFGKFMCVSSGILVTTSGFVSICKNDREGLSFHTTTKILRLIWLYALALSLPPLFGWGRYVPELSGLGCAPDWHSIQSSKTYIVWILVFGFLIPSNIIIISSLLTFSEARKRHLSALSNETQATVLRQNKINYRLVIAMNLAYLTCWSPYALLAITHCFISKTVIGPMLSIVPTIAVKLSVCINPILYIAYNPNLNNWGLNGRERVSLEVEDEGSLNLNRPTFMPLRPETHAHDVKEIEVFDPNGMTQNVTADNNGLELYILTSETSNRTPRQYPN